MRAICWAILVLAFAMVTTAGRSFRGTVVVLPAGVFRGAPENGKVIGDALTQALDARGFKVQSGPRVDAAIKERQLDQAQIQPLGRIVDLRSALNVDFVVYPRVLTVGQGGEAGESQMNILVNVAGASRSSYVYTRQIGQTFRPEELVEKPVIDAKAAKEAATRLVEGFKGTGD